MNWDTQIDKFRAITKEDIKEHASSHEQEQIVSLYNKALGHVENNSNDIALITLRKILSRDPWFGQAAFLAACILARDNREAEAIAMLRQALESAAFPEEEKVRADFCLQELVKAQEEADDSTESIGESVRGRISDVNAAAILEKMKKRGKVKVASDRERQQVIRQAESGEKGETRVESRRTAGDYLHLAVPVLAGLVLIVLILLAAFRWIPDLVSAGTERRQAAERLDWLLAELEDMAGENPSIEAIINEYNSRFSDAEETQPSTTQSMSEGTMETTEQTSTQTSETTAVPTTESPSPTPVETADPAVELLQEGLALYQQALAAYEDDLVQAAEYLLQARDVLAEISPDASLPDTGETAEDISIQVEAFIDDIARSAAEDFRVLGMELFNSREYSQALPFFLKAYALKPDAYGGGVAYYCGRCYQLLDEPEQAKPYFEFVIENFAGRDIAASAASRLNEMGY